MVSKIIKRDGSTADFNPEKVVTAIFKALRAVGNPDYGLAQNLAAGVIDAIEQEYTEKTPAVEEIQDVVEQVLISAGEAKVAKAYILYRQKRKELRDLRKSILQGKADEETELSLNALKIMEKRFLQKDSEGNILEVPSQLFRRVADNIAQADAKYGKDPSQSSKKFYEMMRTLSFLPATPTLINAGTSVQQLNSSFVLPVGDSVEEIFDAMKYAAVIHKTGGGTGFSFSRLRPRNDTIRGKGPSSGPLSFLKIFDQATSVIKSGGIQRGANMAILRVDHPDILEFINLKADGKSLTNFNISAGITDVFMEAVVNDRDYRLINPRTGEPTQSLSARSVFDTIVAMAWQRGDPGIIFLDRINRDNKLRHLGDIESTDSCGEQPLFAYESSPLGSINLAACAEKDDGEINWEKLRHLVHTAVHFLDNVIDMTKYPLAQIEKMSQGTRRIGLGVMGFADLLFRLGIPYDSEQAIEFGEKLIKFISDEALNKSIGLAEERGSFAFWQGSEYERRGIHVRNSSRITIAPTGTISMIADVSPGLEPNFALSFVRNLMGDTELVSVNKYFSRAAKKHGFYSDNLMRTIANTGSIQHMPEIPDETKRIFVTAQDISPEWHIKMQAAFQKYVDNGISKTINIPADASLHDIEESFLSAWKLGCKGITVYRDKSLEGQVISIPRIKKQESREPEKQRIMCPECGTVIQQNDAACRVCGNKVLL